MCADTGTLLLQTAAGLSMNLSASHLCPASATPPPPQINDCLSSFAPDHDQDAEAIENVYSICKKGRKRARNAPPCSTKWPVFTLMGLLIRVTLFMCVLNWRWAQAVILEGDQPCLGLLNLMENLPTAFTLSPTDWKQNNLAFRLWAVLTAKYSILLQHTALCRVDYIYCMKKLLDMLGVRQSCCWLLSAALFISFFLFQVSDHLLCLPQDCAEFD